MNSSPRVVHIVRAPSGGIRLHITTLMDGLALEQILVTNTGDGDAVFSDKMNDQKFISKVISISVGELPSPLDLRNLIFLYFKLRKFKPDILHGHGAKGGLYARLLAPLLCSKSVYSAHGGSLHQVFSPLKQRLYTFVEKTLAPLTSALIFESEYSRSRYFEVVAKLTNRSYLVPNGLTLPQLRSREKRIDSKFVIGAFGLLRQLKGHDLLIDAADILRERNCNFEVRVFGEGPCRAELQAQIQKLNLSNHVRLMGDTSAPFERMRDCDIVVQPSRFESFGYTVVEAMALGVPVVASNVGGLKEIVIDNQTGLLVSTLTPLAIADRIESLIRNPHLGDELAKRARASVEAQFNADRMCAGVLEVYRRICGN